MGPPSRPSRFPEQEHEEADDSGGRCDPDNDQQRLPALPVVEQWRSVRGSLRGVLSLALHEQPVRHVRSGRHAGCPDAAADLSAWPDLSSASVGLPSSYPEAVS